MVFFCIADKESGIGFRLAGVETREVASRKEALEALEVAFAMENVAVIIITEKAALYITAEIKEHLYASKLPIILEVPSRAGRYKRKTPAEVLREAIGISI